MTTSYRVLLSVNMRHAYFANGGLGQVAVQPTPATAERLRRAGLLLKHQPDGFLLLASGHAGLRLGAPLLFSLRVLDPYFLNYSDLPLNNGPLRTYYLSPQKADPTALRLHAGPVLGTLDQLPLRPLQFWQPLDSANTVTAVLSGYPAGPVLAQQVVPTGAKWVAVDVRPWGSGRYQLQAGAETLVFFADDYLAAQRPWGVLAFDEAVLATTTPLAYTLSIASRPTYWQYQVVMRRTPLPSGLAVEGDATLSFMQVPAEAGTTVCFRASAAIALAQRYDRPPLQLTAAAGAVGLLRRQVLWPVLPQASPQGLKSLEINGDTAFISDIFVTL